METELIDKDPNNHLFPKTTSFRMTLECTFHRNDVSARVDGSLEAFEIPGSVSVVNFKEAWNTGGRRLLKGISGVTKGNKEAFSSSKSKKETHTGCFDAAGVRGSEVT